MDKNRSSIIQIDLSVRIFLALLLLRKNIRQIKAYRIQVMNT